jgi:hypothetical protein
MFLKRFLDMLQNRVRICRRHVGRVAVRMRRPRTNLAAIPRKHGSEFGLDAIPVSIVHHRPSRMIADPPPGYGSRGAQMKKAGLIVNGTARSLTAGDETAAQSATRRAVRLKKFLNAHYVAARRADEGTALGGLAPAFRPA